MSLDYPYMSHKLVKEEFTDPLLMQSIYGKQWGMDNPVGTLRQVLMHRPGQEVTKLEDHYSFIESGPLLLGYIKGKLTTSENPGPPDPGLVQSQHDGLADALRKEGVVVVYLEGNTESWPEAIFTRDMGMVVPGGCIVSRLALYIRYGETKLAAQTLQRLGMPLLGTVQGKGFAEGGSFIMLDRRTALIGRSERVNKEGIEQVRHILSHQHIDLLVIDLAASIIHLDEAFLMIDHNKALVNISYLPYWFLNELHQRGIEMLHVDPRDPMLAINAIAVSPGKVIMSETGTHTIELLSHHGIHVIPVAMSEIEKMGGSIHCCTLPLVRDSLKP